ncbi:hypothetical protein BEH94_06520 [Candidatus Altiarchaeales archaeon WOR_SM1_SCG]|nr:hypothetical protein BEH94_06520 [Candidatus Altiarchaeales archaeon WOR_SM1_SCG]ODS36830.1 MAG: hypothetical protein A7315_13930 [Candidatus Altiarchaeales archaeon WOR_SM1_79]ODS37713.1 MAG: hypothetical protein A7316_09145 [Candidatus Altiarchaeales archaeon WOR_SM1_86-2]
MCISHCPVEAITIKETGGEEKHKLIKNWAEEYAKTNGFNVNPKDKVLSVVIEGLIAKQEKFGKRYCPCRIQRIQENICPCVYHKDEIKKDGECHCQLFVRQKKSKLKLIKNGRM